MNFSYRNQKNAEIAAKYWNKPLDKPDWFTVNAISDEESEIFVYDVIGWPFVDVAELVGNLSSDLKDKKVKMRINTPGGDVFDAIALYNAAKKHGNVTTVIESMAASAGSFIALAGKEVQAYKSAMIMVHEPSTIGWGNQYDFREIADVLEMISGNMIDIYAENTKVGKREWKDLLKAETWWTASIAKEKGFVNTILDGKPVKAQFDLPFANLPEGVEAMREGRDLTEREIERALRDAGASRNFAKAVAVGRSEKKPAENQWDAEIAAALTNNIKNLRGA